ncbi:hypothetical protein CMV_020033 [Castanea mollissima]|uniref:Disease resistance RPP13-like protein 1 n=1 Tax=Castanea mollissima TaxID=60419 RepID=A0A8J4VAT5_9ROSI|nr:hypothetical protein CMV_020033 [Castanea mollissima]
MSIVGEALAGAALSAFFDVLFDKLSSSDLLNIFRQKNVDADLKKWKKTLEKISEVLDDAEDKQMTKASVKTWLGELEDLAYDADDILDEFATEALRRKVNAEVPSTSKIRKFIPACCVGFDPSSIVFDVNMPSKIKEINTRLQKIVSDKEDLELIKNTEGRRNRPTRPKPSTTSLVTEGHTYGRDEDKKAIVKLLLESGDAQLSVIPIVGMGGLGKTTLAKLAYDEVIRHFELKAWVCVSEDFDNLRLTKEILRSFTSKSCHDNNDLDSLQRELRDTLSGKKFLLVLDDVWNEDYLLWDDLREPFKSGALGSKIVVTTRNFGVTSKMGTTPPYKLEGLSPDACLRVFTHHALDATDFSKYPELEEFGQKIVNRCKGVPLAAKVLGGLLRERNRNKWEHVLNSKIFDIPEEQGQIFSRETCAVGWRINRVVVSNLKFLQRVECEEFPCLRELSISNCPKLEGKFPHHLPSLKKLSIDACKQLVVSIPSQSKLKVLKIVGCKEVVHGSLEVEKLIIENCKEVTSLCEDGLMSFVTLKIEIKSCQSLVNIKFKSTLRTLTIEDCNALESLQFVMDEFPCLHELSISNCPKLEAKFLHHLPSLEKLSINASLCEDELMSLVTQEMEIRSYQSLVNIKLKSTLRTLKIRYCDALESLQFVMDEGGASSTSSLLMNEENLSCIGNNNASLLEHLEILGCPSLKCVSTIVDQSAMLKRLDIRFCPNLTSLSSKHILPTTLKVIHVMVCPELELIVDELHKDTLLEELKIWNCEKLRRLPRGLHELCHLKEIHLQECDRLISYRFPTNLRELGVAGANLCKQIFELGLHRLTSLTSLSIAYGIMDSFPEEEDGKTMLMLPTSLTSLKFYDFPNLLFLSWKFFQNLSALEQIDITMCPKLASLSEKCFPPSLQRLEIFCCPVLEQNCEKDKGIIEIFLPVEASFKTWRRLHIMLRNNDQWICTVAGWLFNMMPEQHVILTKGHALHR